MTTEMTPPPDVPEPDHGPDPDAVQLEESDPPPTRDPGVISPAPPETLEVPTAKPAPPDELEAPADLSGPPTDAAETAELAAKVADDAAVVAGETAEAAVEEGTE